LSYQIVSKDTVAIGSNLKYAVIHQYGGVITAKTSDYLRFRLATGQFVSKKSVQIPARPYLVWLDSFGKRAADIISDYVQREVNVL